MNTNAKGSFDLAANLATLRIDQIEAIWFAAVEQGNKTAIKQLLGATEFVDVNATRMGRTALDVAVDTNNVDIAGLLISSKSLKASVLTNAFIAAVCKDSHKICRLFIAIGKIDISIKSTCNYTPLIFGARSNALKTVEFFLETAGIEINAKESLGNTALIWAATEGNDKMVQLLLKARNIDVNAVNKDSRTALSAAAHERVVRILLADKRIVPSIPDIEGQNPLMCAAARGQKRIVEMLLKVIDPSLKDKNERTALMLAAMNGQTDVVNGLVDLKGLDINAKDKDGRTALIWAAEGGHFDTVRMLLAHKDVKVYTKDKFQNAAMTYAKGRGHASIVELLAQERDPSRLISRHLGVTLPKPHGGIM